MEARCQTYSPREVSKVLGVGQHAVYSAIRSRRLPAIRLRRKLRVPVAAVEKVLADPASFSAADEPEERGEAEG